MRGSGLGCGMRVSLRLVLIVSAAISVILGINGAQRLERERRLFQEDTAHDLELYGGALAEIVARDWRTEGEAAARELLRARPGDGSLSVELAFPAGGAAPRRVTHELTPEARITHVPLEVTDPRGPLLVLRQSREFEHGYLAESRWRAVTVTLATAAACGLVLLAGGAFFVGRPMRALVRLARRVSDGDLSARTEVRGRDEFADLAREMNLMCERLAAARDAAARETAARIATLEQLRHADRLATVGTLAAGVAHELGTPLNVIEGRAAQIEAKELPRERLVDHARLIRSQVARMTSIIRGLLDFSRRKGGQRAPVDLLALARRTLELLQRHAERAQVTLRLDAGPEPVHVEGDATQLEQVLTNLIVNGIQAMPQGGPLVLALGRRQARHPLREAGGEWAAVAVTDAGTGIREEDRSHLFEPFFTTKEVGQGTGLGLSVVHGIVADHGGWIDVQTALGSGSTFTVCLPLAPALVGANASAPA